jgi:hypothetical protein
MMMHNVVKSAAFALGALGLATAGAAQQGGNAPPAQQAPGAKAPPAPPRPPRRAPPPYKPLPAVTARFEGRSANFTGVVDPANGQLCYLLNVAGIDGATAAKVVAGSPGKPGAVAVTLQPPVSGASGTCNTIGPDTAKALLDHPENYYLEVDNATYPQGAAFAPLKAQTYG